MKTIFSRDSYALPDYLDKYADTIWVGRGKRTDYSAGSPRICSYTMTMTMGPVFETCPENQVAGAGKWCTHYYSQRSDASTGDVLHQETGYWLFDPVTSEFCKAVAMPQGLVMLAGGAFNLSLKQGLVMVATANVSDHEYGICIEPSANREVHVRTITTNMTQSENELSFIETWVRIAGGEESLCRDEATLHLQQ